MNTPLPGMPGFDAGDYDTCIRTVDEMLASPSGLPHLADTDLGRHARMLREQARVMKLPHFNDERLWEAMGIVPDREREKKEPVDVRPAR